MKRLTFVLGMCFMIFGLSACGSDKQKVENETEMIEEPEVTEETYSEFTWPKSEAGNLVPIPDSHIGRIEWEASYGFVIYVSETSQDQYKAYVDKCIEAGFDKDYYRGDDTYYGDNQDGWHLNVSYEGDDVIFIRVDEPDDKDESDDVTSEVVQEEETTSDINTSSTESDIRPEFKEALDSYESFMNDYVEFMKKYNEAADVTALMTDFTKYTNEYAETMDKINGMNQEEMSAAELKYYTEVQARVMDKLAETY